ncbi:unnamed protein product [Rhizoctonia solani]|uniref:NACHT domain-containing protein n=1 Tax=Rhizoctonia solani TaxID=456999 RepID=A0A8H3DB96_9AGAM|nr:unnamed protein product [Rhizoctonia solani]
MISLYQAAARNHNDYEELASGLEDMVNQLVRHFEGTTSEVIKATITSIADAIRKEIESIDMRQSRSLPRRMLGTSSADDDLMRRYRRIEQLFRQLQEQHLRDLRSTTLARFNSELSTEVSRRGCTKHTRTKILEDSTAWSENPELAKIYWMNGMAGTGKTTIAYSLCERLEAGKQLAASFFCTRASPECREAKRIIPTIAYQLARRFTPFRCSLCQQLEEHPDISTGQLSDQFDLLIKKPLLAAKDRLSNNLVIVVDALDECSDPHIVELFIGVLFRSVMELPIKFFITSRPEPAIRNKMMPESERSRSILYLHEIEGSLVQADIELYLREELASISPADEDIRKLAEHAGSLFIYAATAVRHIRPIGKAVNSKARLKAILVVDTESTTTLSAIDALYTAILTDAIHDQDLTPEEQKQMRLVLQTAVCAYEPILIRTLAALSGLDGEDDAIAALQPLRSVLHVSDHSEIVTTLHASFPDFMFDHKRSGLFFCDKIQHSQFLAEACFRVMKAQLRFNICSIRSSFIPNDQVPGLGEHINNNISDELFYACRFWVDHLSEADGGLTLVPLVDMFLSQRLLFWMEVMSLKNCMMPGTVVMTKLTTWLTWVHPKARKSLLDLAFDAQALVAMYGSSPASAYTPHIYLSALPLISPLNAVRSQYLPQFKGLIKVSGTISDRIGGATIGLWASSSLIYSSIFSPDGDRIVLGDYEGNISVRNAYDGNNVIQPFKAHKETIASLGMSSDGTRIVSGSHDMTLSVWSAYDGTITAGPFKGHTGQVNSVAFSPNAALLVSGSDDHIVGIWNSNNSTVPMRSLMGHKTEVISVAFSPDGSRVVSGSVDSPILVWDVSSGTTIFNLVGRLAFVRCVAFSPDGAHIIIISGSDDPTICVWNTSPGALSLPSLQGYSEPVTSIAISLDGGCIALGSRDGIIRLWDTHSGELIAGPFKGHTDQIQSIGFSGDGVRIVSTSLDRTVRVWNAHARVRHTRKGAKYRPRDDTIIASSSSQTHVAFCDNNKIHIWDLQTVAYVVIPTGAGIKRLQFSLDGGRIHSLHAPSTLCTWDTRTAKLLDGPHHYSESALKEWDSVACSVDGTRAVFCHENKATLWHVRSNQSMICETGDLFGICATFSQDGSKFATSNGIVAAVWDGESGGHVAGPFPSGAACLSIDGTYLCCCQSLEHYELINLNTEEAVSIKSDSIPIFTPDGLHMVGQYGRFIRVWNMLGQVTTSIEIPSMASGLKNFTVLGHSSGGELLLSSNRVEGHHICRTHIDSLPFAINPDGWILNHQKQRLVWVPTEIRKDFPSYSGVIISGFDEVLLHVNYDDMLVGDDWSQCYVPDTRPIPFHC